MEEGSVFLQSGGYSGLWWSKEEIGGYWSTAFLPRPPNRGVQLLMRSGTVRHQKNWLRNGLICVDCRIILFNYGIEYVPKIDTPDIEPIKASPYEQLLHHYSVISSQPRNYLENEINNFVKEGLSREEAIKQLAIKEKIIEEEG